MHRMALKPENVESPRREYLWFLTSLPTFWERVPKVPDGREPRAGTVKPCGFGGGGGEWLEKEGSYSGEEVSILLENWRIRIRKVQLVLQDHLVPEGMREDAMQEGYGERHGSA